MLSPDIVARARELVGDKIPIVVLLDMHGNISPRLVEHADLLLAYQSNPHIDTYARGVEAVEILALFDRARDSSPRPLMPDPRCCCRAQSTGTKDAPLSLVHARAAEMLKTEPGDQHRSDGRFRLLPIHPTAGASIIVTSDDQPELAQECADEIERYPVAKS